MAGDPTQKKPSLWAEGGHPLEARERERIDQVLAPGEAIVHFVRGRTDGKRTVWAATDRRIVVVGMTWRRRVVDVPYEAIRDMESQEGGHGTTMRLFTTGANHALVAVFPALAEAFAAHVGDRIGVTPRFIERPRKPEQAGGGLVSRGVAVTSLSGAAAAEASAGAVPLTLVRPTPPGTVPAPGGADLVAALREAADLHRAGALTDEEFRALKSRLLGG